MKVHVPSDKYARLAVLVRLSQQRKVEAETLDYAAGILIESFGLDPHGVYSFVEEDGEVYAVSTEGEQ